jgi:NDP-sugar pyrophosphorylase family protein
MNDGPAMVATGGNGLDPANRPREAREAVILAGGKGVRLRPYKTLLPRPLVPIGQEHSVLEIALRQLADHGFTKARLGVGSLGQIVRAFIGDGSQWGIEIDYVNEEPPGGTIQPLLRALDDLPDHFLVMNGDVLTNLDYADLLASHIRSRAPITVATYQREHQLEPGAVDFPDHLFENFADTSVMTCSVSMGVYAVSRDALLPYRAGGPLAFDQLMLDLIERGTPPSTYHFDGYWLDIGRPDDHGAATLDPTGRESASLRAAT